MVCAEKGRGGIKHCIGKARLNEDNLSSRAFLNVTRPWHLREEIFRRFDKFLPSLNFYCDFGFTFFLFFSIKTIITLLMRAEAKKCYTAWAILFFLAIHHNPLVLLKKVFFRQANESENANPRVRDDLRATSSNDERPKLDIYLSNIASEASYTCHVEREDTLTNVSSSVIMGF